MPSSDRNDEQTQPLLASQATSQSPLPPPATAADDSHSHSQDSPSMGKALKKNNAASPSALGIQALGVTFVALIWTVVLSAMPPSWHLPNPLPFTLPLFAFHPLIQSLSLLLLLQSILVLQPTTTSRPSEKQAASSAHQYLNAIALLPLITAGAAVMWYLHHPANHFISWHGTLGTAVVAWAWVQALFGAATVWFDGKLLGGQAKAKGWWKWHRLSGYVLLPAFLVTFFTGATQTTWMQQNASTAHHVAVGVVLLAILGLGATRVQVSKLPQIRR